MMPQETIEITASGPSTGSLTDLLARHGHPLNARCGQRGLCRGCMVDLLDGMLLDTSGRSIPPGTTVRSCQVRLPQGASARLRIHPQAHIGRTPQVGETFFIDVPCGLSPAFAAIPGKDTGFAVDVGTTTVVVLLADLTTGEVLSRAGGFSAQIRFGDNVITRIGAASDPTTRRDMRQALVSETLLPLLHEACKRAGRDFSRLATGTIAGNTTMLHILADEDPTSLGIAPFVPRFLEGRVLDSAAVGLPPGIPLQLLPGLSAYLGADITAGILATGMALDPRPSLLVDMGTNGEVVLCANGRLTGCATAAGPAFEGAGLSSGTRAHAGAISRLDLRNHPFSVTAETIGHTTAPTGICGSAYIDFLALARSGGWLQANGRFDLDAWQQLPADHRRETEDGRFFLPTGPTGPGISEVDIAHLLQAKGAIGAGIETLLETTHTAPAELGRVYLAGGFGMHIDVRHAIAIGLLPGFTPGQVRVVGNSSLAGALLALLDQTALGEMETLRQRIEVIELNLQPGFEDRYIDHLSLP